MSYEEHVLKHFGEPYHKGSTLDMVLESVHFGTATSEVCGDTITIYARITHGIITEIWWEGDGCCFSQAAASMLAEYAHGTTVYEMRNFSEDDMLTLFQAKCPDARRGCVFVSLEALQNLLESYT